MITEPVVQSVVAPVVIGTMDQGFGVSYYKEGRVLDYGNLGQFTIVDRSPEGNDATLYSGRGISTDGVNDKGIDADCSSLPTSQYFVTGKVKATTVGNQYVQLANGFWFAISVDQADVWIDFVTGSSSAVGTVSVGYASDVFPVVEYFSAAQWAEVSVRNSFTGEAVTHWTCADWSDPTADGLNGKTIVDSGPNQLHGTCTGCEGFTGEGIDPAVAGIVGLDDAQWFNGVDYSQNVAEATVSGDFTASGNIFIPSSKTGTIGIVGQTGVTTRYVMRLDLANKRFQMRNDAGTAYSSPSEGIQYSERDQVIAFSLVVSSGTATLTIGSESDSVAVSGSFNYDVVGEIGGAQFMEGLLFDVSVDSTPLVVLSENGTPVTVGQKRATIPQTGAVNWNKYTEFIFANSPDGKYVKFPKLTAATNATVRFECFFPDNSTSYRTLLSDSTNGGDYIGSLQEGSVSTVLSNGSGSPVISVDGSTGWGTTRGDLWTALVDGGVHVIEITAANLSLWDADFSVGTYGGSSATGTAIIWNLSIDFTSNATIDLACSGLGGASGWLDTVGSIDGVLINDPTMQLVSASDADDQIDAYGTAILEPRTNVQVVNIFGEGELVKTPAAASLDTIKTVSGWIWHDGTARTVIDLGTPTVGTTATDLTSSGFTGVTYFVNGQSGTTLSAGWNHCVVASTAALATDDIDILSKSGSSIDYITTLTVAEVLQNFDAQKALYNI